MKVPYLLGACCLVFALIAFATAGRADTYNLTTDTCSGNCGPQTLFGTVNLQQKARTEIPGK